MAPLRVRHALGSSTIQISFDPSFSVQDLQQQVFAVTNILPSRQIIKAGYPPRALVLVPGTSIVDLDLHPADQIIVSEAPPTPSPLPDAVPVDASFLIHRIVPDDNACLFSSAALVFEQSISNASKMRNIVAQGILSDPETYNEAVLAMSPSQYIATIMKPSSWGGAIELGILAAHYQTDISSIDVETGRIDHFTPPNSSGMRAILIYSGIHYDAASLAPTHDAPPEWHQTLFPITSTDNSDPILLAAKKLADILRSKKAFTNTSTFDLKCEECGQGLKGEKGARAHAEETGHVRFGEY